VAGDALESNFATYAAWEYVWAPYDEPTYQAVLNEILPGDRVLEIGAGDLRLARRIAMIARHVTAIEVQAALLEAGLAEAGKDLSSNLTIWHADARQIAFPPEVTCAVLMMRHCTNFRLYADKLQAIGCRRLITNARWRLGVEVVDLQSPRLAYKDVELGWYACWCGAAGFKPGLAERLVPEVEMTCFEVNGCPHCFL
jgi:SAM-dependent methyltransferase